MSPRSRSAAPLFAALGDHTRLRLVTSLCGGPRSITRLARGSKLTRQAIRKHLRVLEGAGLVRSTRAGRETLFALERARLDEAGRFLERVARQWESALQRLKVYVEK